jgi:nucleotide-binding universal stress UspA family protein
MADLFRRVLVPYDFSRYATQALRTAAGLARASGGRLVVLHAIPPLYRFAGIPPGDFPPPAVSSWLVAEQQQRLERVVAREVGGRGRRAVECRVVVAEPFQAIMRAAGEATAIVMGTLGLTGLARLVLGSVAEKVVRHSPVPVLTVRPGVPAERRRGSARGPRRRSPRRHRSTAKAA